MSPPSERGVLSPNREECYPLIGRSGPLQQAQKFRGNIGI